MIKLLTKSLRTLGVGALALCTGCSDETVTTFVVNTGFAHDRTFRQLVIRQRSEVSWPWYSSGMTVSNQRAQRWIATWRVSEAAPFLVPDDIEKERWGKRDPLGDGLLSDGTVVERPGRFDEAALLKAGVIEQRHCADAELTRVAYDRARSHFVILCERGMWRYRVGHATPTSIIVPGDDKSRLFEIIGWRRSDTRLSLSADGRFLVTWRHDDLPGYLGEKDLRALQRVVMFDIERGEKISWQQNLSEWARILDVDVVEPGELASLVCSRDGAAGWTLALVYTDSVRPLEVPARIKGCSSNDHVIWLANEELLLFVDHTQLDGHVGIDVLNLRTGARARSEWRLR